MKIKPKDAINYVSNLVNLNKNYFYKAYRSNRPKVDLTKALIFSMNQSIALRNFIYDSGGSPTIVYKKFFQNINEFPDDYSFETYVVINTKKEKLKFERSKISYGKRIHGTSHWQNGKLSEIRFIKDIYLNSKNWKF